MSNTQYAWKTSEHTKVPVTLDYKGIAQNLSDFSAILGRGIWNMFDNEKKC